MDRQRVQTMSQTTNLADILERVLDKGIVIAGDISIHLADVELLNIKIRLLIASVEKAKELELSKENTKLVKRIESLEAKLEKKK